MILDHAHKIVCTHLPRRDDRLVLAKQTFENEGILQYVHFHAGVDGQLMRPPQGWPFSRGAYGCLMSHLSVIETARLNCWKSVMVFEDDVLLSHKFQQQLDAAIAAIPDEWDGFYMRSTCGLKEAKTTMGHLSFKTTGSFGRLGCIYKESMYDRLIKVTRNSQAGKMWRRGDVAFAMTHRHYNVYVARPALVGQVPTHSETEGRMSLRRHANVQ